jgi:hypothetical protein
MRTPGFLKVMKNEMKKRERPVGRSRGLEVVFVPVASPSGDQATLLSQAL